MVRTGFVLKQKVDVVVIIEKIKPAPVRHAKHVTDDTHVVLRRWPHGVWKSKGVPAGDK